MKAQISIGTDNAKAVMLQGDKGSVPGRSKDSAGRDTTKFILDGKKYGKNGLVLAIIKKYVAMNPDISAEKLLLTFDKSLQGSLGVVRTLEDVKKNCSGLYSVENR